MSSDKHKGKGKGKGLVPADYQRALVVQDACNLSGIAHSFAEVLPRIMNAVRSTEAVWRHPISVLYSSKIESLCSSSNPGVFSAAYDVCKDKAEG